MRAIWMVLAFSVGSTASAAELCLPTPNGAVQEITVRSPVAAAVLVQLGAYAPPAWFVDADGDGHGAGEPFYACTAPSGTSASGEDCDDTAPEVSPEGSDECGNGVDEDCDGADASCAVEGNGWTVSASPAVHDPVACTVTASATYLDLTPETVETRPGGVCLVVHLGGACTTDADCGAHGFDGGYGYCAAPGGSTEARSCWARPGTQSALCVVKPPFLGSIASGVTLTVSGSDQGEVGWRWMALACMANVAGSAGCASTDPTQYARSTGASTVVHAPCGAP